MPRSAIGAIIGAVICLLVALLLGPLIPEPTVEHIVVVIAWIGFVICVLLAVYYAVTGRGPRTPPL